MAIALHAMTASPARCGELVQVASIRPSPTALDRMARYDHLVDYFSSLHYGPQATSISAAYLRGLIMTESSANVRARSPKGARGLTQIMPETGRKMAAELARSGIDYQHVDEAKLVQFETEHLYDPAINILIACYLNATYKHRYGGRTDLMAAAWNAGPLAVARFGNRPPPYPETRGLLERLHGYMTFFQGGRPPAWSVERWDSHGFDAPGWELDYDAPGWNIGWGRPEKGTRTN